MFPIAVCSSTTTQLSLVPRQKNNLQDGIKAWLLAVWLAGIMLFCLLPCKKLMTSTQQLYLVTIFTLLMLPWDWLVETQPVAVLYSHGWLGRLVLRGAGSYEGGRKQTVTGWAWWKLACSFWLRLEQRLEWRVFDAGVVLQFKKRSRSNILIIIWHSTFFFGF